MKIKRIIIFIAVLSTIAFSCALVDSTSDGSGAANDTSGGTGATGYCGDNVCDSGESVYTCESDCASCGDGICSSSVETVSSCATDCVSCGDGTCSSTESVASCSADCSASTNLTSITIAPSSATISSGGTQQFTATGYYSNSTNSVITGSVTWSSSNGSAATINSSGLASYVGPGSTSIQASLNGVYSNTSTLSTQVLPYSNSNSQAELTALPTISASVAAGTVLSVTVPVDAETGYVVAFLADINTETGSIRALQAKAVTSGTSQSVTLSISIPSITAVGTYQLGLELSTNSTNYSVNTFTRYREALTGTSYWRKDVSVGTVSSTTNTNLTSKRISVTAAGAITSSVATCGTSAIPTVLNAVTIPKAFASTTPASYGSCYFKVGFLSASTYYDIVLDNFINDQDLKIMNSSFTTTQCSSLTISPTAPEGCIAQTDSTGYMYVKVTNWSTFATNFRIRTP